MRKLFFALLILAAGCQSSQRINSATMEVLKTSQILEVMADYQTYMWDKDSLSWHQPNRLKIRSETQPLFSVFYTIGEIKRRNDPAYIDSLILNFNFKKIHIDEDVSQKYMTIDITEKLVHAELLLETSGRLLIDGLEFQLFSVSNPNIKAQLVYVKYYSGWQKDYQIRRFLLRTDGEK